MGAKTATTAAGLYDLIYRAAFDPTQWTAFCQQFSRVFRDARVSLRGHHVASRETIGLVAAGYEPSFLEDFRRHFGAINPWAMEVVRTPVGTVQRSESIFPRGDLVRTEFYNDWLRPQEDIATGAGVTLFAEEDRYFRLSCNIRLHDQEPIQESLVAVLESLVPHMRQSISVIRQLAGIPLGKNLIATLDAAPMPMLILDETGRALYRNRVAEEVLKPGGYLVVERSGSVGLRDQGANRLLREDLAALASRSKLNRGASFLVNNEAGRKANGRLIPFQPFENGDPDLYRAVLASRPVAILSIDRSAIADEQLAGILRERFRLTEAEVAITLMLQSGMSVTEIANMRNARPDTIRKQLKTVFEKIGIYRQAALVSFLGKLTG